MYKRKEKTYTKLVDIIKRGWRNDAYIYEDFFLGSCDKLYSYILFYQTNLFKLILKYIIKIIIILVGFFKFFSCENIGHLNFRKGL